MDKTSHKIKAIMFDYGRTLYDRDRKQFFPEVRQVLEYLYPRYKLAIVSIAKENFPAEERIKQLEVSGFDRYFSSMLFDESHKDHLFSETLEKFKLKPIDAAFVDDRVQRGITWGNKHGAMTIWYRNGKFANELPDASTGNPTYTIENLSSLKEIL